MTRDKVEKGLGRRMSKDKLEGLGILKQGVKIHIQTQKHTIFIICFVIDVHTNLWHLLKYIIKI